MDCDTPRLPRFFAVHDVWIKECIQLNVDYGPKNWEEFIKKCGLEHVSMARLVVEDKKKWMLAKIKYGI